MKIHRVLSSIVYGWLCSIITISIILYVGINTDFIVFGADKFMLFFYEFNILMVSAILIETIEGTHAQEIALDAIVSLVVCLFWIQGDMSWLSYNDPFGTGCTMFLPSLILSPCFAIFSTPVQRKVFSVLDKEIFKEKKDE